MSIPKTISPDSFPKISIITPSLNQGHFIEATIRSILEQGYPNLEYIVIDGGSTDETLAILERYAGRLTWISEKDRGQADAINKGLRMVTGEIMAYLNADDLLLPGALLRVAKVFTEDPQIMWLTGRCRIIDEQGREIRKLITLYKNLWLTVHSRAGLLITDYISQPATFWRARMFREAGPFDDSLHYAMDYEYWLRLEAIQPLKVIHDYLAAFRIHQQSKNTNAGHGNVYIEEERRVIRRHTHSSLLRALHDLHRMLMTFVYTLLNRR